MGFCGSNVSPKKGESVVRREAPNKVYLGVATSLAAETNLTNTATRAAAKTTRHHSHVTGKAAIRRQVLATYDAG